jgi:putative membrane protein
MPLSEKEQQQINSLVGRFEAATGIQAIAAVVGKADAYPEIPWKAYAIGSALAALGVTFFPFVLADWDIASTLAYYAMAIAGTGAAFAAMAAFIPAAGRLFLDRIRAEGEVRQYGLAMFVERQIFCTPERCAILVLVSEYERVAAILPDTGLAQYAPRTEAERIADSMNAALRTAGIAAAFEAGFEGLSALIAARGYVPRAAGANVLEDAVLTEKGA